MSSVYNVRRFTNDVGSGRLYALYNMLTCHTYITLHFHTTHRLLYIQGGIPSRHYKSYYCHAIQLGVKTLFPFISVKVF